MRSFLLASLMITGAVAPNPYTLDDCAATFTFSGVEPGYESTTAIQNTNIVASDGTVDLRGFWDITTCVAAGMASVELVGDLQWQIYLPQGSTFSVDPSLGTATFPIQSASSDYTTFTSDTITAYVLDSGSTASNTISSTTAYFTYNTVQACADGIQFGSATHSEYLNDYQVFPYVSTSPECPGDAVIGGIAIPSGGSTSADVKCDVSYVPPVGVPGELVCIKNNLDISTVSSWSVYATLEPFSLVTAGDVGGYGIVATQPVTQDTTDMTVDQISQICADLTSIRPIYSPEVNLDGSFSFYIETGVPFCAPTLVEVSWDDPAISCPAVEWIVNTNPEVNVPDATFECVKTDYDPLDGAVYPNAVFTMSNPDTGYLYPLSRGTYPNRQFVFPIELDAAFLASCVASIEFEQIDLGNEYIEATLDTSDNSWDMTFTYGGSNTDCYEASAINLVFEDPNASCTGTYDPDGSSMTQHCTYTFDNGVGKRGLKKRATVPSPLAFTAVPTDGFGDDQTSATHYVEFATLSSGIPRRRNQAKFMNYKKSELDCGMQQEVCQVAGRAGMYECVNTRKSLSACGGCPGSAQSTDCTILTGASDVTCQAGKCVVFECEAGYKPYVNGTGCQMV